MEINSNCNNNALRATKDLCQLIELINNKKIIDEQVIFTKVCGLVQRGADVNALAGNPYEVTLLYCATLQSWVDIVRFLLEHGAEANCKNSLLQETPLFVCTNIDAFKLLLEHGADIDALDMFDRTSLHRACRINNYNKAKILIDHGANIHITSNHCDSCISWAALNGNILLMQQLIEQGANIHTVDDLGYSPLHLACMHEHVTAVWLLIMHGAKVDIGDSYGNTPLYYAKKKHNKQLTRLLLTGNLRDNQDPYNWFYMTDFLEQIVTNFSQALAPLED